MRLQPTRSYLVCAVQRTGSSFLTETLKSTAVTLFDYLEISLPKGFHFAKPATIQKQSTARNSEWAARYKEMKQAAN